MPLVDGYRGAGGGDVLGGLWRWRRVCMALAGARWSFGVGAWRRSRHGPALVGRLRRLAETRRLFAPRGGRMRTTPDLSDRDGFDLVAAEQRLARLRADFPEIAQKVELGDALRRLALLEEGSEGPAV